MDGENTPIARPRNMRLEAKNSLTEDPRRWRYPQGRATRLGNISQEEVGVGEFLLITDLDIKKTGWENFGGRKEREGISGGETQNSVGRRKCKVIRGGDPGLLATSEAINYWWDELGSEFTHSASVFTLMPLREEPLFLWHYRPQSSQLHLLRNTFPSLFCNITLNTCYVNTSASKSISRYSILFH